MAITQHCKRCDLIFLFGIFLIMSVLEARGETSSKIRFYFVRHGESEANKLGIFAGQYDSLLTPGGSREAQALGRTSLMKETPFWRFYSSDLSRAHETAVQVLKAAGRGDKLSGLYLDKRLRERSYGPRQGMLKTISVEKALKVWQERNESPPAWEEDEDLWKRIREWIDELIAEVKKADYMIESEKASTCYNVFVASHAGIVRTILLYLVGHERLVELGASWDASRNNRLVVPNTSLSILEIDIANEEPLKDVKVIELTNTKHLGAVNIYDD